MFVSHGYPNYQLRQCSFKNAKDKVELLVKCVPVIPPASSRAVHRSVPSLFLLGEGGTVLAGQGVLSAVRDSVDVLGVGLFWQRKTHLFHCLDLEGM